MDITNVGKQAPPVPPKNTIIPVHTSDRATFKMCRRRWDWSSPMRQNLHRKPSIYGINTAMWFGTGVHKAVELMYDPSLKRDPVETFLTWYNIQTLGGVVTDEDMELGFASDLPVVSRHEMSQTSVLTGLLDLLPDVEEAELIEHMTLGVGMMNFYKEYAERNDKFAVIAAEHDFSIPLFDKKGNEVIDRTSGKPVHYRGRLDAIIQDLDNGRYFVMDHKSAAKADGEQYIRKLEKDEQCTSYAFSAEREAELYDLEYKEISGVLYNTLWKGFPRPPTITTATKQFPEGRPSIDRNQMTTAALWYEAVKERNLDWWVENDEKAQAYAQYLLDAGDGMFIRRDLVYRNRAEITSVENRILDEVSDMLAVDLRVYPNPTSDWKCLGCQFRLPCIARDDGSDWQGILDDGFEKNYDR